MTLSPPDITAVIHASTGARLVRIGGEMLSSESAWHIAQRLEQQLADARRWERTQLVCGDLGLTCDLETAAALLLRLRLMAGLVKAGGMG